MRYLIDTDWVILALRGNNSAQVLLDSLAPDGLAISLITYGEVYEGIYYGRDQRASEAGFHQFLRGVTIISLNRRSMRHFARIRGELRRTGQIIGDPDILIAATALYHDLILVTQNVAHFQRIPQLRLYPSS